MCVAEKPLVRKWRSLTCGGLQESFHCVTVPLLLLLILCTQAPPLSAQEIPCHASLRACMPGLHRSVRPDTYSIAQGFHRPQAHRYFGDLSYNNNNNTKQHLYPWSGNGTLVWLKGSRGQLTDEVCAGDGFRAASEQPPWVGWDSGRISNATTSNHIVPLYFTFNQRIVLTSTKIHTLNPMASGIGLFQRITISVSNSDDEEFERKTWQVVLNTTTRPSDSRNSSQALIVVFPIPASMKIAARHVRVQLIANTSLPWVYISEVTFCAEDYELQAITMPSGTTVEMIESERGIITCQASNVDLLELVKEKTNSVLERKNSSLVEMSISLVLTIEEPHGGMDGGVYLCKGRNSVTNQTMVSRTTVVILDAVDIFRSTNAVVPQGSTVLLQCCSEDRRVRVTRMDLKWSWYNEATALVITTSAVPYYIIKNISTLMPKPGLISFRCTADPIWPYPSYERQATVTVTELVFRPSDRYSNPLLLDMCMRNSSTPTTVPDTTATLPACPAGNCPTTPSTDDGKNGNGSGGSAFNVISAVLLVLLLITLTCLVLLALLLCKNRRQEGGGYQKKTYLVSHHRTQSKTRLQAKGDGLNPDYASPEPLATPSPTSSAGDQAGEVRKRTESCTSDTYAVPSKVPSKVRLQGPYGTTNLQNLPTPIDTGAGGAGLKDTHIYEQSIDLSKILAGDTPQGTGDVKEKRMTRLLALYEDLPPLASVEGPVQIDPAMLKFDEKNKLGEGQFGDVYIGTLRKKKGNPETVAIKTLKPSDQDLRESFDKEVKFMSRMNHEHVVKLLGVCDTGTLTAIVMENMANGDLHSYLASRTLVFKPAARHAASAGPAAVQSGNAVTTTQLVLMMQEIASGMHYLSSNGYVHRDLAARNCLVGSDLTVKIGDFGLTCQLYERAYYRVVGKAVLPLQWMAPESFFGQFSVASDVYAFGVTCWEILQMCRQEPFADLDPNELIKIMIRARKEEDVKCPRLPIPSSCPRGVEELLLQCWAMSPQQRPSFQHLKEELRKITILRR